MAFNYSHVIESLSPPSHPTSRRPSHGSTRSMSSAGSPPKQSNGPAPPGSPRGGGARHGRGGQAGHARGSSQGGRAWGASPVLVHALPSSLTIEKESRAQSELELERQKQQAKRERELAEALRDQAFDVERIATREEGGTWTRIMNKKRRDSEVASTDDNGRKTMPFVRPPQAYELYQAIDKHDLDFISRVRDHAFNLLLQKNAGEFPVVYAARIGATHRDVVIMMVGAFSRYVNQLEEEDFEKKEIQNTLKMLRANLKLAIDNALLPASSSNLLSSYLQVLIMSEGDRWITHSTNDLGLILRDPDSRPVAEAEAMVRRFSTKELRGVPGGVSGVEEYIANATLDLVIMSAWSVAAGQIDADLLPTYTFARDQRTWVMLTEAMKENRNKLRRVHVRVRKMLETLEELAGDSRKGVRGRLRDVQEAIDKA